MEKKLGKLLKEIPYLEVRGSRRRTIGGISHDSRSVEPGDAFVAIPGLRANGHDFIPEALENGARAIFGERNYSELEGRPSSYIQVEDSRKTIARISHHFFEEPTEQLYVVGITGTNGKTTTAHLTKLVLGDAETETVSTLTGTDLSQPKDPVTTPEAPEIHRRARTALKEGKSNLVLEVSSHGLSLKRVDSVDFDCAVFTNISRDHLDYHGSMEAYGEEKLKLFHFLSDRGTAVVNSDQNFSSRIIKETSGDVVTYGLHGDPDVVAEEVEKSTAGVRFGLRSPWGSAPVKLNYLGQYNVYNALAAASVGFVRGRGPSDIAAGLGGAEPLTGRMDKIRLNNGSVVYVDFAHNPDALKRSLSELEEHYESVLLVFGCGGESDRGKRPKMGKIAVEYSDKAFITDDNPKRENRMEILREIEAGVQTEGVYTVIPERKDAIETAFDELTPGSCLLIAGKGHERHQVVGKKWIEYNDRDFVEKLARRKSLLQ